MSVRIPSPLDVFYGHRISLSCARDGQLSADKLHGLFAGDTRVLSTYRITIGGYGWKLLGRSTTGANTAEWHFQNPSIREPLVDIPEGTVLFNLKRQLKEALHDDLRLCSYWDRKVQIRLMLTIDADFSDIFQVKAQRLPPRLNILRIPQPDGILLLYDRLGFRRGLRIILQSSGPPASYMGAQAVFELELTPGAEWTCCLEAVPIVGTETMSHGGMHPAKSVEIMESKGPNLSSAPILQEPYNRGRSDLKSLVVSIPDNPPYIAAGAPWFYTLFGRDQLFTALMAGLDGRWSAECALGSLAPWQAKVRDDWRDAEPGKIPHELRRGELAFRGIIPHRPYYGTHDAPALYCLALWQTWRWTGDKELLSSYLDTASACIQWCERLGDRDGDGLQEYATRSAQGYYNQGWKDAGDAIVNADGERAETPLATVELQGYLFAAYHAMAELLRVKGENEEAERLIRSARDLRARVEEQFWIEDLQFYATALDRYKRPVTSISSNPGHLLWCGLPGREHAEKVAMRFLEPDMFSGWGLRTLSSLNPAYNPLSYQRGSVWPFDTGLAAAGLWRYGLKNQAEKLLRAILESASAFEEERLPELFCGVERSLGGPVPYEEANSPQAWSAAVPLLIAQLFLGIVPDASGGRIFLSPYLPEWLPYLDIKGIRLGIEKIDIRISNRGGETVVDNLETGNVEVINATTGSPLWGDPPL